MKRLVAFIVLLIAGGGGAYYYYVYGKPVEKPTVMQAAISQVREAARAAGKAAGILAPVKADADRYLADGFTMVAVGSDLGLLARGADALIASFNR